MILKFWLHLHKDKFISILMIISIFTLIVYLLIFGVFVFWFGKNPISNTPADWAIFATFVGGILTPLMSIVNILAVILISRHILETENKRAQTELNIEKRKLRFEFLKKIYDGALAKLEDFERHANNLTDDSASQSHLEFQKYFLSYSKFLLTDIYCENDSQTDLQKLLDKATETMSSFKRFKALAELLKAMEALIKIQDQTRNSLKIQENYQSIYGKYLDNRAIFIIEMHESLLNSINTIDKV